jgi:hypothetical protein
VNLPQEVEEWLAALAAGELGAEEVARRLRGTAELGFARLDLDRERRTGVVEAVFSPGKSDDELLGIVDELAVRSGRALVTRLDPERGDCLRRLAVSHPEGTFHRRARLWTLGSRSGSERHTEDHVAVVSAGTSDLGAAEEAAVTAEWLGLGVERYFDVGVAGLHRLLDALEAIRRARAVIVVAGMDGALPTVIAGLLRAPVIAVPTSIGYGASFAGVAPLLTMLNACAPGVAVVNIDNGYGAAVCAHRILDGRRS